MPDESTTRKITSHCGAELVEALNVELQRKAGDAGLVNLDRVRWTPPWLTRWPSPAPGNHADREAHRKGPPHRHAFGASNYRATAGSLWPREKPR